MFIWKDDEYRYFVSIEWVVSFKHWKKNLVWNSHNFLLSCISVEENFIIRITFILKLCFLFFVAEWINFFYICCLYFFFALFNICLSEVALIKFLPTNNTFYVPDNTVVNETNFRTVNFKCKIKIYFCTRGLRPP